MQIINQIQSMGHEQVVFCHDEELGLKAIIAIHDTTLGPALGGCRFWNYEDENQALFDVLRLSRGMTYKASITGLALGGGKSVIIGDPQKLKSEAFFHRFGRFVDSLGGLYITAEDVNIRVEDINQMSKETQHVVGGSTHKGGSGDPSPFTALGVFHGIRACVKEKLGRDSLKDLKVAIQGCGSVGRNLCQLLKQEGARLILSDLDEQLLDQTSKEYGATAVSLDEIYDIDADIFSPCALGAILNPDNIPRLKCSIIAGGANNQLLDEKRDAEALKSKDILYAPDYVINAGGLINVFSELKGYNENQVRKDVEHIYKTMMDIFAESKRTGSFTHEASNQLAEERIQKAKKKT